VHGISLWWLRATVDMTTDDKVPLEHHQAPLVLALVIKLGITRNMALTQPYIKSAAVNEY